MTTNRSILEEGPEKKTVALNLKQAEALKKLQQPTGGQDGTDERADLLQQAKETLRQSATPQILWTATVDGKIFGELPGWRTFTGQSTEEAQCDGWTQALHPEDRDHVLRVWREAVQNQTEYNAGYRLRRHDGVYRDFAVHGVPVRLKDGRIRDWVGCCIDITENKRVAESLKLFRALMDQSSDAIEVIDPQTGRFLDVNETAGRRLGYSREEMLCKSVPDIQMDPFAQAFLPESMEEVRRVGVKLLRGWHRRKDGSTFPVEVSVKSICLDRDYLLAIVRDITEQKAVEEKIESQIHELRFWRESSLDREDRIGALKNEVNEALLQGGEAPRYTDPEVLKRDLPPVDLPVLDSEEERLATLRRYSVLDSPAEKDFDDAVALAAQVCGTPFAAISFLDEERQWF